MGCRLADRRRVCWVLDLRYEAVIAAVAATSTTRQLAKGLGNWNSAIVGGATYLVVITLAMMILPPINEVPAAFSATTLWQFRLASLGVEVVLWMALGLIFGVLADQRLSSRRLGAVRNSC